MGPHRITSGTKHRCYIRNMIPSSSAAGPTRSDATAVSENPKGRNTTLIVSGIVVLGAVLRLVALGAKSFWLDEIASVVIARAPGNWFWHWLWTEEGNMALYYVMLRPWLEIHLGEATVRLLSVLPGVASLPVMYLLGARLFGRRRWDTGGSVPRVEYVLGGVFAGGARLQLAVAGRDHLDLSVRVVDCAADAMPWRVRTRWPPESRFTSTYFGLLVPLAHAVSLLALPNARRRGSTCCRRLQFLRHLPFPCCG